MSRFRRALIAILACMFLRWNHAMAEPHPWEPHTTSGRGWSSGPPPSSLRDLVSRLTLEKIATNMASACSWLVNISQVNTSEFPARTASTYNYSDWRGSFRTEYAADTREWGYMGPVWHGGQAIKALISAADAIPSARMLGYSGPLNPKPWVAGAELGAAFTLRQRIRSGADMGLILAYENACCTTQTSTMLEGMHGLMVLGNHTSNITYTAAATSAAVWALRTLSVPNEPGLMYDGYNQATGEWLPLKWNTITPDGIGRPMNDDSVFLRASKTPPEMGGPSSVDAVRLRQAFYEVLDRLIQSEGPPGNWGGYVPCSGVNGTMHPRQAFWWGMPFIEAFRDTGNTTYLAVAQRSAEWYMRAQRSDGGMFRDTDWQFMTSTFGQVASGSACAVLLWLELYDVTHDKQILAFIERALDFLEDSHVKIASNTEMLYSVIEDSVSPTKTDALPYRLRDIAASFYVQALALLLQRAALET